MSMIFNKAKDHSNSKQYLNSINLKWSSFSMQMQVVAIKSSRVPLILSWYKMVGGIEISNKFDVNRSIKI
jgi:hypothetical protein